LIVSSLFLSVPRQYVIFYVLQVLDVKVLQLIRLQIILHKFDH
jgi:hypothetical protein